MNVWYTADLHLGHTNIVKLCNRPYNSVDEMNEDLIYRWNSVVNSNDRIFVLGDVALGKIDESLALVKQLKGEKILVPGNHDRCWSGHKKVRPTDVARYTNVGFRIISEDVINIDGWRLCHFPYDGDSNGEDRYKKFRPVLDQKHRDTEWLIHGHVHNAWRLNGRQINVGVDVWNFFPVHRDDIINLMTRDK